MRTAVVAVLVVLIALIWFNPGMDAFRVFIEAHSEQLLLRETGDTTLGRVLSGAGGALAGALVDRVTERRNYVVFSTYTVDLDDGHQNDWRFLGLAGHFFELHRPESLRGRDQPY